MAEPKSEATSPPTTSAESDSQLFSTLCEIDKNNYLYLFERCKQCRVNARQLRYFEKDHIRQLIPAADLGILAEFEYLLNEWKIANGFIKISATSKNDINSQLNKSFRNMCTQTEEICKRSLAVNTTQFDLPVSSSASTSNMDLNEDGELLSVLYNAENADINTNMYTSMNYSMSESPLSSSMERYSNNYESFGGESYLLENIIPLVLRKCVQNYKIKKLLTEGDRRLLASSIVDYFESRRIKLRPDNMDHLAEQIALHFPTEGKKAWYHRQNSKGRGRLYMRLYNSHRTKEMRHFHKQLKLAGNAESSTTPAIVEPVSSLLDDMEAMENDDNAKRIQSYLKLNVQVKYEDFSEITNMWESSLKYRRLQMKYLHNLDSVKEYLDNWPSYKMARGNELLQMDFDYRYPNAMNTFGTRWILYKQKIATLLEAELKDNHCLEILARYQVQKDYLSDDSSSCALLYMLHAITKPFRVFKTAAGNVRYCISDSQYSMTRLIHNVEEMNEYQSPHPCIFVLGDTLLDVHECYVVFLDIKYRLSYAECLVVCMQIFSLLKVDDPLPSLHFWQFVRGYLFDMAKDNERPYAVMENVICYLESART